MGRFEWRILRAGPVVAGLVLLLCAGCFQKQKLAQPFEAWCAGGPPEGGGAWAVFTTARALNHVVLCDGSHVFFHPPEDRNLDGKVSAEELVPSEAEQQRILDEGCDWLRDGVFGAPENMQRTFVLERSADRLWSVSPAVSFLRTTPGRRKQQVVQESARCTFREAFGDAAAAAAANLRKTTPVLDIRE